MGNGIKSVKIRDKEFFLQMAKEMGEAITRLSIALSADYQHKIPILLPILNGSFIFAAGPGKKNRFRL